jgi:hypothetical protein
LTHLTHYKKAITAQNAHDKKGGKTEPQTELKVYFQGGLLDALSLLTFGGLFGYCYRIRIDEKSRTTHYESAVLADLLQ